MKCTGRLKSLSLDWQTKKPEVTLEVDATAEDVERLKDKKLSVELKQYRQKRSLDANGLLWACLGEIAAALNSDKWDIYLMMLKRYGKYTYILVRESAVEAVKDQWRESEVIGRVNVNGQESVQMLCYFGSSNYNTKEFSVLLDGVIYEMKEIGLTPPPGRDLRIALERLEHDTKRNDIRAPEKS